MRLSKEERYYKKKLFRYMKIKGRKRQQQATKTIISSDIYQTGGFKAMYHTMAVVIPSLAKVFNKLARTVKEVVKSFANVSECLKELNNAQ